MVRPSRAPDVVLRLVGASLALALAVQPRAGATRADIAEGDPWRPGASDLTWQGIGRLQAFPDFAPEPEWRSALADPEPLVRAAAAAALGRWRDRDAGKQAARLLEDPSPLVRDAALWAVLQHGGPSLKAAVMKAVGLPSVPHSGQLTRVGVPSGVACIPWRERLEWLGVFEQAWQIDARPSCPGGDATPPALLLSAERSEWNADESVTLAVRLGPDSCGRGALDLQRVPWREIDDQGRPLPSPGQAPVSARLRTEDGAARVEPARWKEELRLTLTTEAGLLPGLYVLDGPGDGGPLFFRVRRGAAFEAALPRELGRVNEAGVAERLARQRVGAAGPPLLERLRALCPENAGSPGWSPEINALSAALSRVATPAVGGEAARLYLRCGQVHSNYSQPWQPGAVLAGLGQPGREAVEAFLTEWREHLHPRTGTLTAVVDWPGLPPGSPGDQARLELVTEFLRGPWPAHGSDTRFSGFNPQLLFRALGRLAENHPDEAARALASLARLRETPWENFTWLWPGGSEAGPAQRRALRTAWEATGQDASATARARTALAGRLLELGDDAPGLEPLLPSSDAEAKAWLERLPQAQSTRYVRAVESGLAAYLGGPAASATPSPRVAQPAGTALAARAELRLAFARWLTDHEEPSAAALLAAAALPGLRNPADRAWARSLLGRAHLRRGETAAASGELAEALREARRSTDGRRHDTVDELWLEAVLQRLPLALANPGLQLRHDKGPRPEVDGLAQPARHGDVTFRTQNGGRVLRSVAEARPEPWAASPFRVAYALALGPDRVVIGGDRQMALLSPRVEWQVRLPGDGSSTAWAPVALAGDVILTRHSGAPWLGLDPLNGRVLWDDDPAARLMLVRCASCERRGFLVRSGWTGTDARTGRRLPEGRWFTAWVPARSGRATWEVAGRSVAVAAGKDVVLVVDERDGLQALELRSGRPRWARPARSHVRLSTFPAAAASLDGSVFYVSQDFEVEALEAATGKVLWQRPWRPALPTSGRSTAGERKLVEVTDGVLLAQLWSDGPSGGALDLVLFTTAGDVAFHESVPRPGLSLENWSVDIDRLRFDGPGAGESETWDLSRIPRRARAAARDEPWPSAFASAHDDGAGTVTAELPQHSVRVSGGTIEVRRQGAPTCAAISLRAGPQSSGSCRLEPGAWATPGDPRSRQQSAPRVVCDQIGPGLSLVVVDGGPRLEMEISLPAGRGLETALELAGLGPAAITEDGSATASGPAGRLRLFPPRAYQLLGRSHERKPARVLARLVPTAGGPLRLELGDRDERSTVLVRLEGTVSPP